MTKLTNMGRLVLGMSLVALLAACADRIEEEVGECEPGVGEISRSAEVAPLPAGC
ncbi:hypothetical protein C8N32_1302 [Rhodovulum imhoffii]|uniref:Lipoprotein n=1 Tax=Rhodovulum imhoffii TaxID=365340 RepID=A0A2T5BNK7_9RHOB|nr:hypothetical protein [Rhodovulum imhoffii]PTN00571.1 hypothetical protein C8N32_1302 [Rhodovulum imhoffii]